MHLSDSMADVKYLHRKILKNLQYLGITRHEFKHLTTIVKNKHLRYNELLQCIKARIKRSYDD